MWAALCVADPASGQTPSLPSPTALFTWTMPEHFGQKKNNGVVDYHWDAKKQSYDPDYVNPEKWKVNFNACGSTGTGGIRSYAWTIDSQLVATVNTCSFTHEFKTLAEHQVKLTVTDGNNQTDDEQLAVPVKDYLIVSIGDSIASGEGAPDLPKGERGGVKWVYTRCHRSARSGHAQAALDLERNDPKTSVTFISFACSGAEVREGLIKSQKKGLRDLPAQMDQVKKIARDRPIDALLITIGGNDAYFSELVYKALSKKDASKDKGTLELFHKGLERLPKRFAELNDELSTVFWRPKIFITQYPDIVRKSEMTYCDREPKDDRLEKIIEAESRWAAETVIKNLNEQIAKAAAKYRWILVDQIAEPFYTHGYCAVDPWVHTFNSAKKTQGTTGCIKSSLIHCIVSAGSVHPNYKGQELYRKRLGEVMQANGIGRPPLEPMPLLAQPETIR